MMIMNVFPIGFFFPRQDFVKPPAKSAAARGKVEQAPAAAPDAAPDASRSDQQHVEMPLFSYRFL